VFRVVEMCKIVTYILLVFFCTFNLALGHVGAENGSGYERHWSNLNDVLNVSRTKRSPTDRRLIEEKDCALDFKRLCGNLKPTSDDLDVLECIQSYKVSVT